MNELSESTDRGSSSASVKAIFDKIDHGSFTSKGFETLNEQIIAYTEDLVNDASRVARRYRADSISAAHVEKAAEHLATGSGARIYRHVGTIGGILLGAGLSTVLSLISTNPITIKGLVIACGCTSIGAFLVALHMAKD